MKVLLLVFFCVPIKVMLWYEITLPQQNNQIFASKYQTILPSKETLKKLIEQQYQ